MRLSLSELQAIVKCSNEVFGDMSKIYLFGSRIDDRQKGGDIDLYIEPKSKEDLFDKKIKFLSLLETMIGEQKVDLIIAYNSNRLIEHEAKTKGIELNIEKIKLDKYFNECDKHIQRINEAFDDMKTTIPLNANKYKNLTKDEVQDIDQYLFRFAKLQDTMGDKIFKLLISYLEQNSKPITFIDTLNRLEKYSFIDSAKEWINLRKIRNEISHQYDDEPEEMAQAINNLVNQKEIIENIYFSLKRKYNELS